MSQTPVHLVRRAVVLSAASFGILGGCLTLPGTLLPLLVERFGIRLVEAGSMLALQPVGYLLAVTVAGRLIEAVRHASGARRGHAHVRRGLCGLRPDLGLDGWRRR